MTSPTARGPAAAGRRGPRDGVVRPRAALVAVRQELSGDEAMLAHGSFRGGERVRQARLRRRSRLRESRTPPPKRRTPTASPGGPAAGCTRPRRRGTPPRPASARARGTQAPARTPQGPQPRVPRPPRRRRRRAPSPPPPPPPPPPRAAAGKPPPGARRRRRRLFERRGGRAPPGRRRGGAGRVLLGIGVQRVHARARERHRAAHERVAQRDVLLHLRARRAARRERGPPGQAREDSQKRGGARRQRHGASPGLAAARASAASVTTVTRSSEDRASPRAWSAPARAKGISVRSLPFEARQLDARAELRAVLGVDRGPRGVLTTNPSSMNPSSPPRRLVVAAAQLSADSAKMASTQHPGQIADGLAPRWWRGAARRRRRPARAAPSAARKISVTPSRPASPHVLLHVPHESCSRRRCRRRLQQGRHHGLVRAPLRSAAGRDLIAHVNAGARARVRLALRLGVRPRRALRRCTSRSPHARRAAHASRFASPAAASASIASARGRGRGRGESFSASRPPASSSASSSRSRAPARRFLHQRRTRRR